MVQLPEEIRYLIFEYLPSDIKFQVSRNFTARYDRAIIQQIIHQYDYKYTFTGRMKYSNGLIIMNYRGCQGIVQMWIYDGLVMSYDGFHLISYYPDGRRITKKLTGRLWD